MITLPYSLVIEATEEPDFFGFYSTDLDGFTGIGHSIEDCLYKARWGMADHIQLLREQGLPVPSPNPNPTIVIQNTSKFQPPDRVLAVARKNESGNQEEIRSRRFLTSASFIGRWTLDVGRSAFGVFRFCLST